MNTERAEGEFHPKATEITLKTIRWLLAIHGIQMSTQEAGSLEREITEAITQAVEEAHCHDPYGHDYWLDKLEQARAEQKEKDAKICLDHWCTDECDVDINGGGGCDAVIAAAIREQS